MPKAGLPAASLNCILKQPPTDALIDLIVWYCLRQKIAICGLDLVTLVHLRISTVIPQRWPERRADVQGLIFESEVIEYLPE